MDKTTRAQLATYHEAILTQRALLDALVRDRDDLIVEALEDGASPVAIAGAAGIDRQYVERVAFFPGVGRMDAARRARLDRIRKAKP